MCMRFFLDLFMFLVVSCDVVFMVTNRLAVFRVLLVVMKCLNTFVVAVFGVLAFGKFT